MATRDIVPRADNEGGLGNTLKKWATGFINALSVASIKITTGASANKILTSDADGDASWTDSPTVSSIKITTGAGVGKTLTSDADGDASWADAAPAASIIETQVFS